MPHYKVRIEVVDYYYETVAEVDYVTSGYTIGEAMNQALAEARKDYPRQFFIVNSCNLC